MPNDLLKEDVDASSNESEDEDEDDDIEPSEQSRHVRFGDTSIESYASSEEESENKGICVGVVLLQHFTYNLTGRNIAHTDSSSAGNDARVKEGVMLARIRAMEISIYNLFIYLANYAFSEILLTYRTYWPSRRSKSLKKKRRSSSNPIK